MEPKELEIDEEARKEMQVEIERQQVQYERLTKVLTEREIMEMDFCAMYRDGFHHGTDGHNIRMLVAKLYELLLLSEPFKEYKLVEPSES